MTKYRKKPIEIEAVQFTGDNWDEIQKFTGIQCVSKCGFNYEDGYMIGKVYIKTLEGEVQFHKGDWIIKGIKGEFYPCKPDIFDETYEEVKK